MVDSGALKAIEDINAGRIYTPEGVEKHFGG